jgi:hypothetical protein
MILTPYSAETAAMLREPPGPGAGRHHWLYRLAYRLIRTERRDPDAVRQALETLCRDRGWADRLGQVAGDVARVRALSDESPVLKRVKWPEAHPADRAKYAARPRAWPRLTDREAPTAGAVLETLYSPEALICTASSPWHAATRPACAVLPLAERLPYLVANPMVAATGKTLDGYDSPRCKANACTDDTRRWVVVEFDTDDDVEAQCNVLAALDTPDVPLRLAVFSGRRSVHGWYDGAGVTATDRLRLFRLAVWLGADRSLWDTCKLVRMPGGRRETGECQTVLYWGFDDHGRHND